MAISATDTCDKDPQYSPHTPDRKDRAHPYQRVPTVITGGTRYSSMSSDFLDGSGKLVDRVSYPVNSPKERYSTPDMKTHTMWMVKRNILSVWL
jgi:hypothetical protein